MNDVRAARLERNIPLYYLQRVLAKRMVFPILTIFLLLNRLSVEEIGIIFSVGSILGLAFEVPSGIISDRIGRKNSMLIANAGWAASMLLFWAGDNFWWYLAANAVYYAAGSFFTGTSEAFVYETLAELGRPQDMRRVMGRALSISQIVTGVLFVAVPFIATYSLALPFLLNAAVFFVGMLVVMRLVEPERTAEKDPDPLEEDRIGFRLFLRNPLLLSIGLAFGALGGIGGIIEDFRQIYLHDIGLDLAYFGILYLALRLLTGGISESLPAIERRIGKRGIAILIPVITIAMYAGLAFTRSIYGLAFIVLDGVERGLSRPLEQDFLNRTITGPKRAALLSVFNLLTSLLRAACVFVAGFIIGAWGIHAGFLFALGLTLVITLPLYALFLRRAEQAGLFKDDDTAS